MTDTLHMNNNIVHYEEEIIIWSNFHCNIFTEKTVFEKFNSNLCCKVFFFIVLVFSDIAQFINCAMCKYAKMIILYFYSCEIASLD